MPNDKKIGWVILQREQLTVQNLVSGTLPKGSAVLIGNPNWLRQMTLSEIFEQSLTKLQTTVVSPEEVSAWGLQTGMKVEWIATESGAKIVSVDGIPDAEIIRKIPQLSGVRATQVRQPVRPLPLDRQGDHSIRAQYLLAPVAKGQRLAIIGAPGSGKTTLAKKAVASTLELMNTDENLYFIGLGVGERTESGTSIEDVVNRGKESLTEDARRRVEFYHSPDAAGDGYDDNTDSEEAHWFITWFVTQRARWLARLGYDVVYFIDSLSRVMLSYDWASKIKKPDNDPIVSPGIHVSAIKAAKRIVATAGDFPQIKRTHSNNETVGSSLTVIFTVLGNYKEIRPPAEAGLEHTALSLESALWILEDNPLLDYPRTNIVRTRTRDVELFMNSRPDTLAEMVDLKETIWKAVPIGSRDDLSNPERGEETGTTKKFRKAKVEEAHKRLIGYVKLKPIPPD